MQLIILGMHRSGTSALTGLLAKAGAYAGEEKDLLPAREANQKGYWERTDVVDLNEAILALAGADWCHVSELDSRKLDSAEFAPFKARAGKIIGGLGQHQPWVIKDPRLCLTFPLWRDAMDTTAPAVCILMYRQPSEVALSLRKRDGIPLAAGAALWEKHQREALRVSEGLPRMLVSYNDLISRPAETARILFDQLEQGGIAGLRRPSESDLAEQIDPGLRRARGDKESIEDSVDESQAALFTSLSDGSALQRKAGTLSTGAAQALREFEEADARRDPLRPLRLKLRVIQELLKSGEVDAAQKQFSQAWKSGWKQPHLWRLKATVMRRGFSDGHAKRALRQTMKDLNRLRPQAHRG